jgi:uncharacterized protein
MKVRCLWLAFAMIAGCATSGPETSPSSSAPIEYLPALKGDYFRFPSREIGRSFHIYVSLPDSYSQNSSARYPVVYVLDGDSLFPVFSTHHRFLVFDEGIPEAIIVGISYGSFDPAINKRAYDFSAPAQDATSEQGGAPAFQSFLKHELIPEIERRHRADPARRVLIGQSRGGHMVLYSAFTDPDLFWGRIASNPPFDPGRQMFFARPERGSRADLGLVVTSGSRDLAPYRQSALDWFKEWERRTDAPWALHAKTIEGGTHAADITNSYRIGMLWLFNRSSESK